MTTLPICSTINFDLVWLRLLYINFVDSWVIKHNLSGSTKSKSSHTFFSYQARIAWIYHFVPNHLPSSGPHLYALVSRDLLLDFVNVISNAKDCAAQMCLLGSLLKKHRIKKYYYTASSVSGQDESNPAL